VNEFLQIRGLTCNAGFNLWVEEMISNPVHAYNTSNMNRYSKACGFVA
jgi:hypothetical protein